MRLSMKFAVAAPVRSALASAQFRDLDTAMSNSEARIQQRRPQAIVAGIGAGAGDAAVPGLVEQSDFFGRDQAAYLLDGLFNKVKPTAFEEQKAVKSTAEQQYHITGTWTIQNAGKAETRELYITLKQKGERWVLASVKSGSRK